MNFSVISLHTNGVRFAEKDFAKAFLPSIRGVMVSFPSADPHTYARITRKGDDFSRAIQGIKNMLKFDLPVVSNTVINKLNYRQLPDIARRIVSLGIPYASFTLPVPDGNMLEMMADVLPPSIEAVGQYFLPAKKILENHGVYWEIPKGPSFPSCFYLGWGGDIPLDYRSWCDFFEHVYFVDIDHQFENHTTLKDIAMPDGIKDSGRCGCCVLNPCCEGVHKLLLGQPGYEIRPVNAETLYRHFFSFLSMPASGQKEII